jgi:hypothetical protein
MISAMAELTDSYLGTVVTTSCFSCLYCSLSQWKKQKQTAASRYPAEAFSTHDATLLETHLAVAFLTRQLMQILDLKKNHVEFEHKTTIFLSWMSEWN